MKRKLLMSTCAVVLVAYGASAQTAAPTLQPASDPRLQETAAALLNSSYYDTTRAPLAVGELAPDFELSLAKDCPLKIGGKTQSASKSAGDVSRKVRLSSFVAKRLGEANPASKNAKPKTNSPTVLIFWAFWCDTWRDATRDLKKLRPQLEAEGAGVLCVAVDASQQPVARRAFSSGDIWFPVVIDEPSTPESNQTEKPVKSAGEKYGVRRVPTVFVLDSSSRIRARFEGFPKTRALMEAIQDAKQPAPKASPEKAK